MSHRPLLSRIQKMFAAGPHAGFENTADKLEGGRSMLPVQPMSDHELAGAIWAFRVTPISDWRRHRFGKPL